MLIQVRWKSIFQKENAPEGMVESALKDIKILENLDFDLIKVAIKSSDVEPMMKASSNSQKN